ncbi:MAG: 5'-methylthioadenosine/adenosylhomocysteine nucleosidase [Balneolaceae bacterium]
MEEQQDIIAIIGALDEEIKTFVAHLENPVEVHWKEFTFYEGILTGKKVVIVKCGVGKVFAALTTQKLIDTYQPSVVIFSGVAGALNESYEIGDIVVAKDCIQHDLEAEALNIPRGTVPYTDYNYFNSDPNLLSLALSVKIHHNVHQGRVLTGDQFLTKRALNEFSYLTDELKGDVVEMEGAAVGQVCTVNEVPFLIIRTISDKANEEASINFTTFVEEVAKNSFAVTTHILSGI